MSQDGTPEQARAALYGAAAQILTGQFESGVAELNSVDAGRLPRQDVELKNATTSLAKMIGDSSGKASGPAAPEATKDVITSADASNASASTSALIDFAQQKLGQSDEVLKRKSP